MASTHDTRRAKMAVGQFEHARQQLFELNMERMQAEIEWQKNVGILTALETSEAVREAEEAFSERVVAYIRHIDYDATAKQLVDFLVKKLEECNEALPSESDRGFSNTTTAAGFTSSAAAKQLPIVTCEIMRNKPGNNKFGYKKKLHIRPAGTSAGWALVTFRNEILFNTLKCVHASSGLVFQRRYLFFEKSMDHKAVLANLRNSMQSGSFFASDLQLGYPCDQPFIIRWEGKDARLEFNAKPTCRLDIVLKIDGKLYCIEIPLRSIIKAQLTSSEQDYRVITVQVLRPPSVFRHAPPHVNLSSLSLQGLSDSTLQSSEGQSRNKFFWNANGLFTIPESEWVQTIDPTPSRLFSRLPTFRMVMKFKTGSDKDLSFIDCIKRFRLDILAQKQVASRPQSPVIRDIASYGLPGWSSGHDDIFSVLPFKVRYYLHGLIASYRLFVSSSHLAESIVKLIQTRPLYGVLEVLESAMSHSNVRSADSTHLIIQKLESVQAQGDRDDKDTDSLAYRVSLDNDETLSLKIRRVLITPSRVCPQLPENDLGNRILRQGRGYKDRFVRVTFVNENFGSVLSLNLNNVTEIIDEGVRRIVMNGFTLAGHHYVYLAYSSSQLREHSCWFYDETDRGTQAPCAEAIRASMGDLSQIGIVGKYASRLGQGLSSSVATEAVHESRRGVIKDVTRNGYCFSDGVGMIAEKVAQRIARHLYDAELQDCSSVPSAFQIRFGGSKGVVSVAPNLELMHIIDAYGRKQECDLILRPSMIKFEGNKNHNTLEVLSVAKPGKCFLNRQLITVLTALGVKDKAILKLLYEMLAELDKALNDSYTAIKIVKQSGGGGIALRMLLAGFDVCIDPYLRSLVYAIRNRILFDLQTRARIFVDKGIMLMGIMDETQSMEEGTIFFQYTDGDNNRIQLPHGTKVAVTRSPCLHPGDVIVLSAVNVPSLNDLVNVAVFPAKGLRPHPNEMSGGDLDGDLYIILFDKNLIPTLRFPAMKYNASPNSTTQTPKEVTVEDMKKFFVDYIVNDNVGKIANAHVVHADLSDDGIMCPACLTLAELHSTAVDFCKTGEPAEFPYELRTQKAPTFMEKSDKESYVSKKLLGKIYEHSRKLYFLEERDANFQRFDRVSGYDEQLVLAGHEEFIAEATKLLADYCSRLWQKMQYYEVKYEGELMSGCIRSLSRKASSSSQRERSGDFLFRLNRELSELQRHFRELFWDGLGYPTDYKFRENQITEHELLRIFTKTSAWYKVAYTQQTETPLLSFAWIMSEPLCALNEKIHKKECWEI